MSEQPGDDEGFEQALNAHRDMLLQGRSFSGRERNVAYLNLGKSTRSETATNDEEQFANVSGAIGIDFPDDGRGLVKVDWDGDGDLDFWISNRSAPRLRFLRNDIPQNKNSISLRLTGNGTSSNRDAIGARVEIVSANDVKDRTEAGYYSSRLIQTVGGSEGFLSQSTRQLIFGLGENSEMQRALVRWPDGTEETFDALTPGERYQLVQGTGQAKQLRPRPSVVSLDAEPLEAMDASAAVRIPLLTLLPMPVMKYNAADGKLQSLPKGKPLLVNLWATWCAPCRGELLEMTERKDEFDEHGIDVVALCMDDISSEPTEKGAADTFLKSISFPFTHGNATQELAGAFQSIHDLLVVNDRPLPAPTSFLIDAQGRLAAIYKGRVDLDQVFKDAKHSSLSGTARFANSAPLHGKMLENEKLRTDLDALQLTNLLKAADSYRQIGNRTAAKAQLYAGIAVDDKLEFRNNLASLLMDEGRISEADLHLKKAMAFDPEVPDVLTNLGNLRRLQQRVTEAEGHYLRALEIDPTASMARNNYAALLASQGDVERAIGEYEKVLAQDPNSFHSHFMLADLLRSQGKLVESLPHYAETIASGPPNPRVHNHWGLALLMLGRNEEAAEQFEQAIELAPEYAEAKNNLRRATIASDGKKKN